LETISHFPVKLSDALSETNRAIGKLKKLVPDAQIATPKLDLTDATSQFKDAFHARLKELRAQTPGYEEMAITRIVQRSLQRRKPFDARGQRGLRDAIIWEGVLELGRTTQSHFEMPRLANLNASAEDFEVGEVYRIDGGEIGFSIEFTVKGVIECDEIEDYDPRERPWTTEFAGGVTFKIQTSQVLEEATGQVNEFTIERVKIIPGFQWPYDDID